jgi:hypothetical protein
MRKKAYKRSFLLLEILIALFLLSLCLFPIARNPIFFLKSQLKIIDEIHCQRIADLTFCKIKEKLYQNEICWDSLIKNKSNSKIYSDLKDELVEVDNFYKKEIKRSYKISIKNQKKGQGNYLYRILNVEIYLLPKNQKKSFIYNYNIFVQKKHPPPKEEKDKKTFDIQTNT